MELLYLAFEGYQKIKWFTTNTQEILHNCWTLDQAPLYLENYMAVEPEEQNAIKISVSIPIHCICFCLLSMIFSQDKGNTYNQLKPRDGDFRR